MKPCVICEKEFEAVKKNIVRCPGCRLEARPKSGICLDCGTSIGQQAKRCKPCHNKAIVGEGNPNYIGRGVTTQGYILLNYPNLRNHPNAQATGRIAEHIYVMSEHLGRALVSGEEVHHMNGDRSDNRNENLELWTRSHPTGVRVKDLYTWAVDYIKQYQEEIDQL